MDCYITFTKKQQANLDFLEHIFSEHFQPKKHNILESADLAQSKKFREESISDYYFRMKKKADVCKVEPNILEFIFLQGLPMSYRKQVAEKEAIGMQEIVSVCKEYEKLAEIEVEKEVSSYSVNPIEIEMLKEKIDRMNERLDTRCRVSHNSEDRLLKYNKNRFRDSNNRNGSIETDMNTFVGNKNDTQNFSQAERRRFSDIDRICYFCWRRGHVKSECRDFVSFRNRRKEFERCQNRTGNYNYSCNSDSRTDIGYNYDRVFNNYGRNNYSSYRNDRECNNYNNFDRSNNTNGKENRQTISNTNMRFAQKQFDQSESNQTSKKRN